jgi:hypothetical protein
MRWFTWLNGAQSSRKTVSCWENNMLLWSVAQPLHRHYSQQCVIFRHIYLENKLSVFFHKSAGLWNSACPICNLHKKQQLILTILYYGLSNTMFSKRPAPLITNCCVNKGVIQVVTTESHLKFCSVENPVEYSFCANFQTMLRATCVERTASGARQEANGRHYKSGCKNPWHFNKQSARNCILKAYTLNNNTVGNFCHCSE